jgi:hypothetical protein
MNPEVSRSVSTSVPKGKRIPEARARSVPHRQVFVKAVMLSAIHYLGIFATATTLVVFFSNRPLSRRKFSFFAWDLPLSLG